jgi:hypothetical protein
MRFLKKPPNKTITKYHLIVTGLECQIIVKAVTGNKPTSINRTVKICQGYLWERLCDHLLLQLTNKNVSLTNMNKS